MYLRANSTLLRRNSKEYDPPDATYPPHLRYVHPLYFLLKKKIQPNKYCDFFFALQIILYGGRKLSNSTKIFTHIIKHMDEMKDYDKVHI